MLKYASSSTPTMTQVLDSLTPIQLPSDEEIENQAEDYGDRYISSSIFSFEDGAKWMRDKILNK